MSTVTLTQENQVLQLRLRLRASSDALLDILDAHADWEDPLSRKLNDWALEAFQGVETAPEEVLMEQMRGRFQVLDQKILVDSLYRKPIQEIPYLIDGENVLPESAFDDLYYTANQVGLGSPFNAKPMALREKVHGFALAILRWRGVACEGTPPLQAVPWQEPAAAMIKCMGLQMLAQGSLELARGEEAEKMHLKNAERMRAQAQLLQAQRRDAILEATNALREQNNAFNRRLDGIVQGYETRIRELLEQIGNAERQIADLNRRVDGVEQVNEEHRQQIAALEARVRAAEAEIARIRAQMDDDDFCVIS